MTNQQKKYSDYLQKSILERFSENNGSVRLERIFLLSIEK